MTDLKIMSVSYHFYDDKQNYHSGNAMFVLTDEKTKNGARKYIEETAGRLMENSTEYNDGMEIKFRKD